VKTLLIIGHTFPEPSTTAAGTRIMQLIKMFDEEGYEIIFASSAIASEKAADLNSVGIRVETIKLNNPGFDELLTRLDPDVVIFDRYITEEQFGWRVAEQCPGALRVLDTEDLHFLRKAREQAVKDGIPVAGANLFTNTAKRELASILRSDLSLIISEAERTLLTEVQYSQITALLPSVFNRSSFRRIYGSTPRFSRTAALCYAWELPTYSKCGCRKVVKRRDMATNTKAIARRRTSCLRSVCTQTDHAVTQCSRRFYY